MVEGGKIGGSSDSCVESAFAVVRDVHDVLFQERSLTLCLVASRGRTTMHDAINPGSQQLASPFSRYSIEVGEAILA
jgi:hypothetical protein